MNRALSSEDAWAGNMSLALGFMILFFIFSPPATPATLSIQFQQNNKPAAAVQLRFCGKLAYFEIRSLAEAFAASCSDHPEKHSLTCQFDAISVNWTADNAFVSAAGRWRQLAAPVIFQDGQYWAPLTSALDVLDDILPGSFDFNMKARRLVVQPPACDVYDVQFVNKENGVLVAFACDKQISFTAPVLKDSTVTLSLLAASFDRRMLQNARSAPAIERVTAQELGDEVLLTFCLGVPILECSAWYQADSRMLNVSFVTRLIAAEGQDKAPSIAVRTDQEINSLLSGEQKKWKVDCVVIDPGHGGKDPGAIGVTGLREKDVTLEIGLRLKQLLSQNKKLRVIMTHEDDRFVPLNQRTKLANREGGKLFISIHCNASKSGGGSGFETYFLKPARNARAMEVALRENAVIDYEESTNGYQALTDENYILLAMAQSEFVRESEALADVVQTKMRLQTGLKDRGVDQAGFYVLVGASMPAILVETAFLTSKREEKLLKTKKFRQQVAQALYESIVQFMNASDVARENISVGR